MKISIDGRVVGAENTGISPIQYESALETYLAASATLLPVFDREVEVMTIAWVAGGPCRPAAVSFAVKLTVGLRKIDIHYSFPLRVDMPIPDPKRTAQFIVEQTHREFTKYVQWQKDDTRRLREQDAKLLQLIAQH